MLYYIINIGMKKNERNNENNEKIKKNKMCNKIQCAGQYTVDLIHNNISRIVQEKCTNNLYRVHT